MGALMSVTGWVEACLASRPGLSLGLGVSSVSEVEAAGVRMSVALWTDSRPASPGAGSGAPVRRSGLHHALLEGAVCGRSSFVIPPRYDQNIRSMSGSMMVRGW